MVGVSRMGTSGQGLGFATCILLPVNIGSEGALCGFTEVLGSSGF